MLQKYCAVETEDVTQAENLSTVLDKLLIPGRTQSGYKLALPAHPPRLRRLIFKKYARSLHCKHGAKELQH